MTGRTARNSYEWIVFSRRMSLKSPESFADMFWLDLVENMLPYSEKIAEKIAFSDSGRDILLD